MVPGAQLQPKQREKALVMIDFITKPWAQKTYALAGRNSLPVNRKAAKIVASKIPGGTEALVMYAEQSLKENAAKGPIESSGVPRSGALRHHLERSARHHLRRQFPEESSKTILKSLRESGS